MNLLYYNTSWKSIELRIPRITLFTTSQFVLKTWTIRYNIPITSNALVPPIIVNLELVDYPRPSEKAVDIQTCILNFERVFVTIVNIKGRKIPVTVSTSDIKWRGPSRVVMDYKFISFCIHRESSNNYKKCKQQQC